MKIRIRPRGVTLTKPQCLRLKHNFEMVLARFGERIDRVTVEISDAEVEGLKFCKIEARLKPQEVCLKPQIVSVEYSDTDVFLAMEHAAQRVARSVSRAIEVEGLVGH